MSAILWRVYNNGQHEDLLILLCIYVCIHHIVGNSDQHRTAIILWEKLGSCGKTEIPSFLKSAVILVARWPWSGLTHQPEIIITVLSKTRNPRTASLLYSANDLRPHSLPHSPPLHRATPRLMSTDRIAVEMF